MLLSGQSVRLTPVAIQSLSELERARLQEVAYARLHQDYDVGCQITVPKDGQKRKKSLRRKLDSLSKEKSKDKEGVPQAFSIPLSQVIANDRMQRQRQDGYRQDPPQREDHKDSSDLVSSILQVIMHAHISHHAIPPQNEQFLHIKSKRIPSKILPSSPVLRRRGGMSVDSITDLDDNQSRLLEALQLSLPAETPSKKEKHKDKRLSLNPIYRQVPRVVDSCCQHIEKYGLQTVGIFRVGSSKKRVRQLREEFDRGVDVHLDEEHSVHDVAALLKEFLRDMPDPLLTKELYTAFINTTSLDLEEQQSVMQLLVYLLPASNSDTLHRLLAFLSTVADHAHDSMTCLSFQIAGNKMTSLNLATIFGPNLLHKLKSSDKEFSVQSSARAEESTAVIATLQRMIASYQTLFMVPPDLQNEVLMSLLETDPDVVDYLLRRKASHCIDTVAVCSEGSHGNVSEGSSRSSQEGLDVLHGDSRHQLMAPPTRTLPGIAECRPHLPLTRVCTSSHLQPAIDRSAQVLEHAHGACTSSGLKGWVNANESGRFPPPYNAHHRLAVCQSSPGLAAAQQHPLQHKRSGAEQKNSDGTVMPHSPEWQDWQRDRWQIWQLLSSDSADTLPETLV
uniref:Rho GTPase activating protein 6 n=1 Tax=Hippocampus comes TaxID=109280 RepID=A0A3Q2Y1F5_HIPCM